MCRASASNSPIGRGRRQAGGGSGNGGGGGGGGTYGEVSRSARLRALTSDRIDSYGRSGGSEQILPPVAARLATCRRSESNLLSRSSAEEEKLLARANWVLPFAFGDGLLLGGGFVVGTISLGTTIGFAGRLPRCELERCA